MARDDSRGGALRGCNERARGGGMRHVHGGFGGLR